MNSEGLSAIVKPNRRSRGWLRWLNLRPEESERTFLMFAFYTMTSVGILWLEVSVAALFLGEYGATNLPWIYIASAGIGTGLGFIYSWMQRLLPLRRVIVITAVMMGLPLLVFQIGLSPVLMGGYTIFIMRLWLEAIYVINELNTSITANQLFTIREVKRTYPLISSGILAADVISGFSLPFLREWIGLSNVILLSSLMLLLGAGILYYLTRVYHQFFPETVRRRSTLEPQDSAARRLRGPLRHYVALVFAFFIMLQVLALLLDFQYLSQLEQRPDVSVDSIADFLALFSATLGMVELGVQWFISGRAIERMGVFFITALPPVLTTGLSILTLTGAIELFIGVTLLKFVDELLRYTLVASTGPVLFQPIPDASRSRIQSIVRGIAEPLSTGLMGVAMLSTIWLLEHVSDSHSQLFTRMQNGIFLLYTAIFAVFWFWAVLKLRSQYIDVLVLSANRGQIALSDSESRSYKRGLAESLERPGPLDEKQACLKLLVQLDAKDASNLLAPMLEKLPPLLQRQALEAMLDHPDPAHLHWVKALIQRSPPAGVLTVALRYVWLTEATPDIEQLQPYLEPTADAVMRSMAASLLLRRGDSSQKSQATAILRRMLTSKQERERVMGCRALGEALYLQSLRLHLEDLLQDESIRVRCAALEAIAATQEQDYYPALVRGLGYKSTREAARQALLRLENDAIPLLTELGDDPFQPERLRNEAWQTLGQLGSSAAIEVLVNRLQTAWGTQRRTLLHALVKLPQESGIEAVTDLLGRDGIETLINQELLFLAHIYASLVDFTHAQLESEESSLLRRSLHDSIADSIDRLFLLMRLLYDSNLIQAAALDVASEGRDSVARGLEILDNTLDISKKQALLNILDTQSDEAKLESLSELITYRSISPPERLRKLLDLRYFLSDWTIACCFYMARRYVWSLPSAHVVASLQQPTGYVREAVLAYLQVASPKTLVSLLPSLQADPDPLVAMQVRQWLQALNGSPDRPSPPTSATQPSAATHSS